MLWVLHRSWKLFFWLSLPLLAQHSPQGNVDLVSSSMCQIAGWARDADTTSPVNVQIFADGAVGTGSLIATVNANLLRSDLPFPDQNHGFFYTFVGAAQISDGNSHLLYVYAVDATGDPNTLLHPGGSSITCGSLTTNVKAFGAAGDASTDDAPAIQAAINATAPGGTVLIPAGTYMLITPQAAPGDLYASAPCNTGQDLHIQEALLVQKANVTVMGVGRGTILKLGPNAKMPMIDLIGQNDSVQKLVVDGNGAARVRIDPSTGQPYGWPCGLVVATLIAVGPLSTPDRENSNALIRDVEARNGLEDGASGFLASGMMLDRIYAHDLGGYAYGYGLAAGAAGVELAGGSGTSATNNVLLRNTTGVQVSLGVTGATVENNVAVASCGQGLGLGADFAYQGDLINSNIHVKANWLESNGTVCNDAGIIVGDGVQNSAIFNNTAVNNNFIGVQFEDEGATHPSPQNVDIEQNTFANLTTSRVQKTGVSLNGLATGVVLRQNNIYDNGTSMPGQVFVAPTVQVNSDWPSTNTISYSPPITYPTPQIISVTNAASGTAGSIAPGEVVILTGSNLGPSTLVKSSLTASGYYPRLVAGTRVLFDTVPAAILYTSANRVAAVVPYFEYWRDNAQIKVEYQGSQSPEVSLPIAGSAPGFFDSADPGLGFGAILNQDGSINSASNPALPGSYVSILGTGEGQTDPAGVDARVTSTELPTPRLPLMATVNGRTAQIQSANETPGLVSGVVQVRVSVPVDVSGGSSVPIQMTLGGQPANTVNCAIQAFALGASSASFTSAGGSGSVTVNAALTGVGSWTAQSPANWIIVTSGSPGVGSGTVSYSVSPNTGNAARSATLTIAGRTFTVSQDASAHLPFFNGEVSLGSGVYYLQFSDTNLFGYYNYPSASILYHYDLGFEAFVDGGNGAVYLYDFASQHWWYTSSALFPNLYDFTVNSWIYYFPDTKNAGHYTTNPRYFSNLTTKGIFTM